MGGFYANITVRTKQTAEVIRLIESIGLPATVASADGFVVVVDELLDDQEDGWLAELTLKLSAVAAAPALGVLNHDDSLLLMSLAVGGSTVASYNSCPDYSQARVATSPPAVT